MGGLYQKEGGSQAVGGETMLSDFGNNRALVSP